MNRMLDCLIARHIFVYLFVPKRLNIWNVLLCQGRRSERRELSYSRREK